MGLVGAVPLDWEAVPHCSKDLLNGVAWDSGLGCGDSRYCLISEPLHRYLIQDDTLFRMQSAVIHSHLTEGTGMVLGKLRRVSLTQTNRSGMKPTPILRMSLPKMGFDLGVVRRLRRLAGSRRASSPS